MTSGNTRANIQPSTPRPSQAKPSEGVRQDAGSELRILILAPTGNDARLTAHFLNRSGLEATICGDVRELCKQADRGCGGLLVAEEALDHASVPLLAAMLARQPSWSDLPIAIVTAGSSEASQERQRYLSTLGSDANIALIERPFRQGTLVSACEVALRSRRRQYQVRDLLEESQESKQHLEFVLRAGGLGAWKLDLNNGAMICSDTCNANFGIQSGASLAYEDLVGMVYPGDREAMRGSLEHAIEAGSDYQAEYRITTPTGEPRWIGARGRVVYDEAGTPRYMAGVTQNITERKRVEHALRDAQERLVAGVAAAGVGTWIWDIPNDRLFADESLARMFVSTREGAGNSINACLAAIHPEDVEAVQRTIGESLRTGTDYEAECRLRQANGGWRWFNARGRVERAADGGPLRLVGAFIDIETRKQQEAALDELSRKLEQQARIFDITLSAISDFAYIFDRQGRFRYVNKALLNLWGLELSEAVGKNFFDLHYPEELATRLQRQIQYVIDTGKGVRDETPYTSPAGVEGYYEYILSPVFGSDGSVEVVAGSTRDFTEHRKTKEALAAQAKALRESDRRKDEFLAMLAHELRNPLASVANAAALLKSDTDAESRSWATGVVERQTRHLARLIDDLLDVSRITTGKIRLRRELIDTATVLERACESAQPLIHERRHELFCDYPRGVLWVEADATRLEQIILNLLTNAAKYTRTGGRIDLVAMREDGWITIQVRDNGIGIPADKLPTMFELFAQGERSIARSEGGLGIGLTIVQKLAEMHGGRIDAASDGLERGSTFTIRLPASAAPATKGDNDGYAETSAQRSGLRVLVVDDNLDTAQGLARLLRLSGHQTEVAHDGPAALERARFYIPDAVLLDIGLPGMDGYEVAAQLREDHICGAALLIAISGYGQDEDRRRSRAAGFDHHLIKPVDLDHLRGLLALA
ncbi:PAS domain-containing protein [Verrucomicrobiota bacterium sgz303538]